jgi:hypothetical protein
VRAIDWTRSAYDLVHVRRGSERYALARLPCALCSAPIRPGDRYVLGPRARKAVHADCRARLVAGEPARRPRDPRVDPRPGDVLDDDPPAAPLCVHPSARPDTHVSAARYAHVGDRPCSCAPDDPRHPHACRCEGCVCVSSGAWPIEAWRREMADAVVVRLAGDGS